MVNHAHRLKIAAALTTLVAAVTAGTYLASAKVPDVYITYETGGHTCWNPSSPTIIAKDDYPWRSGVKTTKPIGSLGVFETGWTDWAINRDGSDVNCLKINLYPDPVKTTTTNFRLCGQAAEVKTSRSFWDYITGGSGSSRPTNIGPEVCTDGVDQTAGNFMQMATSKNSAIGAVRLRLYRPDVFAASDNTKKAVRTSTQLHNINGTQGGVVSTAWSNLGFVNANVNQAGGHLNSIGFALEAKLLETAPSTPTLTGDIRVDRVQGSSLTAISGTSAWLDSSSMEVTNNPALFLQLSVGNHTVKVTNFSGAKEFGLCQFDRGGSLCTPATFSAIPASTCDSQKCPVSLATAAGKVTRVVARYSPPANCSDGIDNNGDGKIDSADSNCSASGFYNGGQGETGTTGTPPPPPPPLGEAACTFSASPLTIVRNVGHTTLTWACTGGGTTANISGIGSVAASGTRDVSPTVNPTTYTLTYSTVTKSVTITVNDSNFGEIIP